MHGFFKLNNLIKVFLNIVPQPSIFLNLRSDHMVN